MQKEPVRSIVTLTSDWGMKDHYLASVKGQLLNHCPEATVVDVSHEIAPFNLSQTAFILRNCYHDFPKGTIHIVAVNSEPTLQIPHVVIAYDGYFFIGADNGMFSLLFDETPDTIIEVDMPQMGDKFTFPSRDVFVLIAKHLVGGGALEELGNSRPSLTPCVAFRPTVSQNVIIGKVIYIDRYENVILNITEKDFETVVGNRAFELEYGVSHHGITKIGECFKDVSDGNVVALFNSGGYLSIAINQGNASSLLGLHIDDTVRIEIKN